MVEGISGECLSGDDAGGTCPVVDGEPTTPCPGPGLPAGGPPAFCDDGCTVGSGVCRLEMAGGYVVCTDRDAGGLCSGGSQLCYDHIGLDQATVTALAHNIESEHQKSIAALVC